MPTPHRFLRMDEGFAETFRGFFWSSLAYVCTGWVTKSNKKTISVTFNIVVFMVSALSWINRSICVTTVVFIRRTRRRLLICRRIRTLLICGVWCLLSHVLSWSKKSTPKFYTYSCNEVKFWSIFASALNSNFALCNRVIWCMCWTMLKHFAALKYGHWQLETDINISQARVAKRLRFGGIFRNHDSQIHDRPIHIFAELIIDTWWSMTKTWWLSSGHPVHT